MSIRDKIRALRLYYKSVRAISQVLSPNWHILTFPFFGKGEFVSHSEGKVFSVPKKYWQMLPSAARMIEVGAYPYWKDDVLHVAFQGSEFTAPPMDKSLGGTLKEIFLDNVYKLDEMDLNGKVVLDVGAYVGDSAIAFAKQGAMVHAFEPLPILQTYLKENIRLNNLGNQIEIHPVGLSDKNEVITINATTCGFAGATVLDSTEKSAKGERVLQNLQLVNAVEYLHKSGIGKVYFLKLDCEGCEYALFQNVPFWEMIKPEIIMMEFHRGGAVLASKLEEWGYQVDPYEKGQVGYIYARFQHENSDS
ncbi:FkbM family methyltransferase [Sulfurirhabdus autotrophica]|uniref:FkbM family methyltransferase n=1 Tax=Sulfurirhabdus autotrophica TaxID=1706046 RepID=A0A4R3XY86_9PROT|nr:FkbM family methyltransferase [Sulfurirhabdus autotrophica]TCV84286.1 FkbM family methyltransferase [Sulfurirhabdus autotrophica]